MTELDDRLAEALREAVPAPPSQLDPETIRERSARRRRPLRRYAPALAAAVVIAVAVTVALTRGGSSGGDAKRGPAGDPADVFGVLWRVQTVNGADPGIFKGAGFQLRIKASGHFAQTVPSCDGFDGRLILNSTEFVVQSARPFYDNCISIRGEHELMSVMQQLFVGRITWSIDGNQLTLQKDGGPTVVYTSRAIRHAGDRFTAEVVLDRTTAPANGEPISGSLVVDNETGAPIVISDACDGWHAVGLANEQVSFDAAWPQVACASKNVPVGTTTIPIQVNTTYNQCSENPRDPIGPHCLGPEHSQVPPLPPGDYTTKVVFRGLSRDPTLSSAITVTLTNP